MNAPLNCDRCPRLCASRRTVVNGVGPKDASILIVSISPDSQEERHGEPLHWKSWAGKQVKRYLIPLAGIDPSKVRYEFIAKCNPPNNKQGKPSAPSAKEIDACRPYLLSYIETNRPTHILTLGALALKWFFPDARISEVHGQKLTWKEITILPMLHPDQAKAYQNPKLALVMDQDWKRAGEYINGNSSDRPNRDRNDIINVVDQPSVGKYTLVSGTKLARLLRNANPNRIAFDVETVKESNTWEGTFQARRAELIGYSVAWEEGVAYYVEANTLDAIKPWLEDPTVSVICHNAQYEYIVAKNYGVTLTNVDDTKLLAYLLRKPNTSLKALSWSELMIKQIRFDSVDWSDINNVAQYGAMDSDMTLRLYNKMWPEMEAANLVNLYTNIERPLIPVIARMVMAGVIIDPTPLVKLEGELNQRLVEIDTEIATLYPYEINWRSVPQKHNAIFGAVDGGHWETESAIRRLTYKEWSKEERGNDEPLTIPLTKLVGYVPPGLGITTEYGVDTDIPTLHRIELAGDVHPIIPLLIERSTISRALSGEITKLPKLRQEDGRVHSSFHQSGGWEEVGGDTKEATDTGRLSSSGPNLHNITSHGDTSRPYVAEWGRIIRTGFIAPDGYGVVKADVGQEEPRLAAYLSGDEELRKAVDSGDMYLEAAALAYKKPANQINREERQIGKRMFMAWLNRAGPAGIQKSAFWLSKVEAQEVLNYMCQRFEVFEAWCRKQVAFLRQNGHVRTYFDRIVSFPEVWTGNLAVVSKAERACIPGIIQGSAGDILKIIMRRIQDAYDDLGLKSQLVLCVHDELVSYVPEDELDTVIALHMGLMEGIIPTKLPMDVIVGKSWGDGNTVWEG